MKKALSIIPIFIGLTAASIAAPNAGNLSGGYFGNGSVKPARGPEIFYNSLRFNVRRNGNVTGSATIFATGGVQAAKRIKFKATLSNIQRQNNGNTRAKIQGKFADGTTLRGTVINDLAARGGAKLAKGKMQNGARKGTFYGDGSGGSIVRIFSDEVEVTNLLTGTTTKFPAIASDEGGASVSQDGTIAHLQERATAPEGVTVRLNKLDGTFIREFFWAEPFSFVRDGARISPDGRHVAFCLRVPNDRGESRVYVFETSPPHRFVFWELVCAPGWTIDNRLIAVDVNGKQMYLTNQPINTSSAAANLLAKVGPGNLPIVEAPEGTPDGRSIVFSDNGGVARTFSMDIATGAVRQLLSDGVGQFHPVAGGRSLFFAQKCCTDLFPLSIIHHVPLNLDQTIPMTIGGYFLEDRNGENFTGGSSRYGYTPASF